MMLKGVEHATFPPSDIRFPSVKIPMMPKGVEHKMGAAQERAAAKGEDSNDAERRYMK